MTNLLAAYAHRRVETTAVIFSIVIALAAPSGWVQADKSAPAPDTVSAPSTLLVTKVDGKGVAKVRRAKGTIKVLAIGDRLAKGDRVLTEGDVIVEALLGDGSLVRIAPNSDYEFKSFEHNATADVFTWAFGLAKGGVRAIVEKKDNKKHVVKFKVNTPAGTMGVRGTELLLLHDQEQRLTSLYTFSGQVLLGRAGADVNNTGLFELVDKDRMSTIHEGDKRAAKPRKFNIDELLRAAWMQAKSAGVSGEAGALATLLLGANSSALRDFSVKADLSDADLERLKKEVVLTTDQLHEIQAYLSDYQGLENEKIAAVMDSLEREGADLKTAEGKPGKQLSREERGAQRMARTGRLSKDDADRLALARVKEHLKKLEDKNAAILSGKPMHAIDSDLAKLKDQLAAVSQEGVVAQQAAAAPVCTSVRSCRRCGFLGLRRCCRTRTVCMEPPSAPNIEQFPAAADTAQAINNASPPAPSAQNDDGRSADDDAPPAPTPPATTVKKPSCCKLWLPCREIQNQACIGKGKTVDVCDKRCSPSNFGAPSSGTTNR